MADYDVVMNGDWQHRVRHLESVTPEEKAELLKTHRRRWLKQNRSKLTPEQIQMLEEDISLITPDIYRWPRNEGLFKNLKEHEARIIAGLPRECVWQLTLHGPLIPDVTR